MAKLDPENRGSRISTVYDIYSIVIELKWKENKGIQRPVQYKCTAILKEGQWSDRK
jgi:hypothetical protein